MAFLYTRRIKFYETDLMKIVHHSNYLRFCEEARVEWAISKGLMTYQQPNGAFQLAVLETKVKHLKPCLFGDDLAILVQAEMSGVKVRFQYRILKLLKEIKATEINATTDKNATDKNANDKKDSDKNAQTVEDNLILEFKKWNVLNSQELDAKGFKDFQLAVLAETTHVAINQDLKAIKPPAEMQMIFRKEQKWTETWL